MVTIGVIVAAMVSLSILLRATLRSLVLVRTQPSRWDPPSFPARRAPASSALLPPPRR